jgi:hypothetical protein
MLNETQSGRNILSFDTTGRFLFNIDKVGHGPGEYNTLKDISIDEQQDLLVLDVLGNLYKIDEYMYFDTAGKFLYSKECTGFSGNPLQMTTIQMISYNDSLFVVSCSCGYKPDCQNILFMNKHDLSVVKSFDCTNIYTAENDPRLALCKAENTFLFYSGNDTIYDISLENDSKIPVYYVNFGEKQRAHHRREEGKPREEHFNIFKNAFANKEIKVVYRLFNNQKYLAVNYGENEIVSESVKLNFNTVFYNIENGKSYNTENINFDIFNSVKNKRMEIVGCADGYFYAVLNSPFSEDDIEEIAKSKFLSEQDKQAFLSRTEDANPVILVFK